MPNINDVVDLIESSEDFEDIITSLDDDGVAFEILDGLNEVSNEFELKAQEEIPTLSINPQDPVPTPDEPVLTTKVKSKMDQAKEIYTRMVGQRRCDVIRAFMAEIGITQAHAGTYYQTISKKV